MNLVTAIIRPHMLDPVKEALQGAGATGITVTQVTGFGRQGGHTETYRGAEYQMDFVPKVKIEVLADGASAGKIADVIAASARTASIGDGKIWVTEVGSAVRIRTGERDDDAI